MSLGRTAGKTEDQVVDHSSVKAPEEDIVDTVAEIMAPEPITAHPSELVGEVRDRILTSGIHFLPVVDDGRAIGVVSSWDLVEEYQPEESVTNVMTDRVVMIGPHASIDEAARRMLNEFIHHLVVVDETGKVVGIVSSFDLLAEFAGPEPV
jgi:CBS domain-containing protein